VITASNPFIGQFLGIELGADGEQANFDDVPLMATVTPDTEKPVISVVSVTPDSLWPPNQKLVLVAVNYSTSDNCGVASSSLSATSNEPDDGLGDGDQPGDVQLIPGDSHHL
jgi:hypothetical protein